MKKMKKVVDVMNKESERAKRIAGRQYAVEQLIASLPEDLHQSLKRPFLT